MAGVVHDVTAAAGIVAISGHVVGNTKERARQWPLRLPGLRAPMVRIGARRHCGAVVRVLDGSECTVASEVEHASSSVEIVLDGLSHHLGPVLRMGAQDNCLIIGEI